MKDEVTAILYAGTAVMVFLALVFILLILWSAYTMNKFKKFYKERDTHYMERIEGLESLIRTEFKAVVQSLKNI